MIINSLKLKKKVSVNICFIKTMTITILYNNNKNKFLFKMRQKCYHFICNKRISLEQYFKLQLGTYNNFYSGRNNYLYNEYTNK